MCGRYATTRSATDLAALFEAADDTGGVLEPDFNVAPTDPVPIVRVTSAGHRSLCVARWGLVPAWSKDPRGGARMINARAERVAEAPAFARAFAQHRCLVPADGWYEWRPHDDAGKASATRRSGRAAKQAYFMTPRDGGVMAFAGLWSVWGTGPDRLLTCSVLTMEALGPLGRVHDRMPLIMPSERWAEWLTGESSIRRLVVPVTDINGSIDRHPLLAPPSDDLLTQLEIRPVGPAVGDVRNNDPSLVTAISLSDHQSSMTLSPPEDGNPTGLTLF